jgi:predicted transposase YbfD/YdcC
MSDFANEPPLCARRTLAVILSEHFDEIDDPRIDRTKLHLLSDLLTLALCSTLAGGTTWEDMQEWASSQQIDWLRETLGLQLVNGVPHHDTFARTISRIPPEELEPCLSSILSAFRKPGESISIDGKVLRGSHNAQTGQNALTILNAWANDSRLMLAQDQVPENTNEIGAMQALLERLDISGSTILADAAHCQKKTVEMIRSKGADYLLTLKDNQPKLYEAVSSLFARAVRCRDIPVVSCEQFDREHGRLECRRCHVILAKDWLFEGDPFLVWHDLRCLILVERRREWSERGEKKTSESHTFYISSLPAQASSLLSLIRSRWGIENSAHYVLDVVFGEDNSRIRQDHGPVNLSLLRRVCLNLVRIAPGAKGSLKSRIKRAGWSRDFLRELLLTQMPQESQESQEESKKQESTRE